jgi:hypothetical protein
MQDERFSGRGQSRALVARLSERGELRVRLAYLRSACFDGDRS